MIQRKLVEVEYPSKSIEQQYERVTNLDRYWRKSKREEERLRKRKEAKAPAQRTNTLATASKAQEQQLSEPQVWLRKQKIP